MSICADHIRFLDSVGIDIDGIATVAEAMSTSAGFSAMSHVITALEEMPRDFDFEPMVLGVARYLIEREPQFTGTTRDSHTGQKDSNRSRRGMGDAAWRRLRREILERDKYVCQYCGSSDDLTCDHVLPLVRGGTNDPDNLVAACRRCNSSKGDKHPCEWRP